MVDVDHLLMPSWKRSNSPPACSGNYIAHRIKLIHDDSQSVFPESVYSSQTQVNNRWKSLMKSDFVTMDELRARAKKKKMTQPSMFMTWKVPSRLTDRSEDGNQARPMGEIKDRPFSVTNKLTKSCTQNSAFPGIKGAVPRPDSNAALMRASAPGRLSDLPAPPILVQPKSTRTPKLPKALATQQLLKTYQRQESTPLTNEFLKKATPHEKAVVEKAIKMETTGNSKSPKIRNMEKWFQQASNKDKQIASEFFKSLTGNQLPNKNEDLLKMLQNEGTKYSSLTLARDQADESQLRYIRLLTPNTRSKRFEYQTWHHMPNYNNSDPVNNISAMYTTANGYTPRHFVIHPDWG